MCMCSKVITLDVKRLVALICSSISTVPSHFEFRLAPPLATKSPIVPTSTLRRSSSGGALQSLYDFGCGIGGHAGDSREVRYKQSSLNPPLLVSGANFGGLVADPYYDPAAIRL